jgi:hypothetical protein
MDTKTVGTSVREKAGRMARCLAARSVAYLGSRLAATTAHGRGTLKVELMAAEWAPC